VLETGGYKNIGVWLMCWRCVQYVMAFRKHLTECYSAINWEVCNVNICLMQRN